MCRIIGVLVAVSVLLAGVFSPAVPARAGEAARPHLLGVGQGPAAVPVDRTELSGRGHVPRPAPARRESASKRLHVAFVLRGKLRDEGWGEAHGEGVTLLKKRLGERILVATTENVADSAEAERVFRNYAEKGYALVVNASDAFSESLFKVARDYPRVRFMQYGESAPLPNVGAYAARIEQSEYLVGYMAGLMRFHDPGIVAKARNPRSFRSVNAFALGFECGVNEAGGSFDSARLATVAWSDAVPKPAEEKKLVDGLLGSGCDLIVQMVDSPVAVEAACRRGKPAVGRAADAARFGASCALTSAVYAWGPFYYDVVRRLLAGEWRGGVARVGLESRAVGLAPMSRKVPRAVIGRVLALRARMARGKAAIFVGPLTDGAGRLRLAAGSSATPEQLAHMDWLLRGVRELDVSGKPASGKPAKR